MKDLNAAAQLLNDAGFPKNLRNTLCCRVFLALCDMAEESKWSKAKNPWVGIHEIMDYLRIHEICDYAENTRESIRRDCIKPYRDMAVVEDNGLASNNRFFKYRLTDEFVELVRTYNTNEWEIALKYYQKYNKALIQSYQAKKEFQKMPVRVNGQDLKFSPGKHNQLQKTILEEFATRFAKGSVCLYVGDSADRDLYKNTEILAQLHFDITLNVLPDVVLYIPDKKWLYFIECVTSVGPVSERRKKEFEDLTRNVDADNIYVTAFPDRTTYKKFISDLAWETEVWISEEPDHMIHLNGHKFLGPRKEKENGRK